MADINKTDIQIKASQRLDDTEVGGGQMTATQIVSGAINNLFPDISRLDRVYGRVSLRKAFLSVTTETRKTYYGSHAVLTQQTKDPNVGVCFFSSKDWFDTRTNARNRMESYLVKGPIFSAYLWGNHYVGTKNMSFITDPAWPIPLIGDVLVLVKNEGLSTEVVEYVRTVDVSAEIRTFVYLYSGSVTNYTKKVISITIGNSLVNDFPGHDVTPSGYTLAAQTTHVYTTVAADASRYYGVATLKEDVAAGLLQIRVDKIQVPLVPSAQSETAITDAGVGSNVTSLLQTRTSQTVTRSVAYSITANSKLYIGEGILPGTFVWTGGQSLTDDLEGNVLNGSNVVVGSIDYVTGVVTFGNPGVTLSGTGSVTYTPASAPTEISDTGAIRVEIANRGFTYVFFCNPIPKKGTLKIDFLSGGKWYTLKDTGFGQLKGSDPSIGSGAVNFMSGSVSMTLGAMPDVASNILLFWGKEANYYDMSGETLPLKYNGVTRNLGIVRNTFKIRWGTNQCIMDNGLGKLVRATGSGETWTPTATEVGSLKYASGKYDFGIDALHTVPLSSESFRVTYVYGPKKEQTFSAPPRDGGGVLNLVVDFPPILPGTFEIEWHTLLEEYDAPLSTSGSVFTWNFRRIDPTHTFQDDGAGIFRGDVNDGTGGWVQGTVNYGTGAIRFQPDRRGTFPHPLYGWVDTGLRRPAGSNAAGSWTEGQINRWSFQSIEYLTAACIWPTDGSVTVRYADSEGATADDYQEPLQKKFFIKSTSNLEIVPGSLSFYAGIGVGAATTYLTEIGGGKLYKDIVGTTGLGVEAGLVNYDERSITITDDLITARSLTILFCTGSAGNDVAQTLMFRCPGSPIRAGSIGVKATLTDGTLVIGNGDLSGNILGDNIVGEVDYNTGICTVAFGRWITDTFAVKPPYVPGVYNENAQPMWYADAPLDGAGKVWYPKEAKASTVSVNCIVTSYLPLDADLLGMNPVRLPIDGKVPIFRDGYILLIHNTQNEVLPTIAVPGPLDPISRFPVELIELYDSRADVDGGPRYWPDGGNYTTNLDTGVITVLPTYDVTGFTQPFKALHRIEDMVLASDVQITGHIAITAPLKHSYLKDVTQVSSVLPFGDLQGRAYGEFDQNVWSGVWSDDVIGSVCSLANYNFVDNPITVINETCTKERWLLLFKSTTTINIVGENLGTLVSDLNIVTGNYNPITGIWAGEDDFVPGNGTTVLGYIAVRNKNFNKPYWVMPCAGFGTGWVMNNCIRFNTDAANYPVWFVRTTLQAAPTEAVDNYVIQIRGDSA